MTDDVDVWYFMIPIAMVFVGIAIALFFWSVKNDQFDDLDRHGSNILFDDDKDAHQYAQHSQTQAQGKTQTETKTESVESTEASAESQHRDASAQHKE